MASYEKLLTAIYQKDYTQASELLRQTTSAAKHLDTAIERGHFDIVKCLVVDCGCKPTTEHLDTAIQRGHFDIVKCLVIDCGCKPTTRAS